MLDRLCARAFNVASAEANSAAEAAVKNFLLEKSATIDRSCSEVGFTGKLFGSITPLFFATSLCLFCALMFSFFSMRGLNPRAF
jgi:hypothetical protein